MNDCYVFGDANAPLEGNIISIGVMNVGNATLNNCHVSAIKSGLDTRLGSKTYVNGGIYESTDHGGIYFCHGPSGEAYINGAKIVCCEYKGKYEESEAANFGGFYIGGVGEAGSNMKAYINNCSITGGSAAFVIRGSSGEQNNEVYISNSTIGTNKVRIDNDTLKLYIGKGCNFAAENTNRPNSVIITNDVYIKK